MTDETPFERLAAHSGPAEVDAGFEDHLYRLLRSKMDRPRRSGRPALLLVAALLALIAVSAGLAVVGGLVNPPSPDGSATPRPSATASDATPVAGVFACPSRSLSWDGTSAVDLTGAWSSDHQGVYYIRQIGNQIWWTGMSGLGGPMALRGHDWTNVYLGTLSGLTISGTYADVPGGQVLLDGPVSLRLTPTPEGGISLVRVAHDSPFRDTVLLPCTPQ